MLLRSNLTLARTDRVHHVLSTALRARDTA